MRIGCTIQSIAMLGEHGQEIDGTSATCGKCDNAEEAFGTGDDSIKRCLAQLRESCPHKKNNFYVDKDARIPGRRPSPDFVYHGDCELTEAIRRRYDEIVVEMQRHQWEKQQQAEFAQQGNDRDI